VNLHGEPGRHDPGISQAGVNLHGEPGGPCLRFEEKMKYRFLVAQNPRSREAAASRTGTRHREEMLQGQQASKQQGQDRRTTARVQPAAACLYPLRLQSPLPFFVPACLPLRPRHAAVPPLPLPLCASTGCLPLPLLLCASTARP
jgi:hypothetical protein